MSKIIVKGTVEVSVLTMVSRVLGFVRDLLTAFLFGSTYLADAFFVAFKIPNLLRSFVAEGALNNAFVPVFVDELAKSKEQAKETMRSMVSFLLITTIILSVLGIVFAKEIIGVIAPGFVSNPKKQQLCILLTQIMLPYIMCVSIVSMLNGALNAVNIFGRSAWAQIWMNICLITGAVIACFFAKETAIFILAYSVIAGGVVQIAIQLPTLKKAGFSIIPGLKIITGATKQVALLMLPAILGVAAYQLQIVINTLLASLLESGSVSWLFYAERVVQLPIGVFTVALSSVLLPVLARASAENNSDDFATNLTNSLRYVSFVIIPISGILYFFAEPIAWLLFERGQFDHASTLKTAQAIQNYSFGLWAVSSGSILLRVFFAKKNTVTPTLIGVGTLVFTAMFSMMFMGNPVHGEGQWLFKLVEGGRGILLAPFGAVAGDAGAMSLLNLKHAGLALGSSVAVFCSLAIIIFIIARSHQLNWMSYVVATAKTLLAVLLAGIAMSPICNWINSIAETTSSIYLLKLFCQIPLFIVLILLFMFIFKTRELIETCSMVTGDRK